MKKLISNISSWIRTTVKKITTFVKNIITKSRRTAKNKFYTARANSSKNVFRKIGYSIQAVSSKYFG